MRCIENKKKIVCMKFIFHRNIKVGKNILWYVYGVVLIFKILHKSISDLSTGTGRNTA